MPYVERMVNGVSEADRAELDPLIFNLLKEMKNAEKWDDLILYVSPAIDNLALKVLDIHARLNVPGAFIGLLNYSEHRIFLNMLPELRYRFTAITWGWIARVALLFTTTPFISVEREHERKFFIDWRSPLLFKHLTEWVAVRLARRSAPDFSQDSSDFIVGMFGHLNEEFYRRVVGGYEDKQILKNGDLPEYQALLQKIAN